jgi:surfeit locus 1 family protein
MTRFRPAFWPTLIALPMLLVLAGLGAWQLQRLAWKNQLIGEARAGMAAAAVELPRTALDAEAWAYRRVIVDGRFHHGAEIHLLALGPNGQHGYRIVTPLLRGGAHGAVLVDRGWVPAALKDAAARAAAQVDGPVAVSGVVRRSWRGGWFTPDNDPARNLWHSGDAAAMLRWLGLSGPDLFVAADAGVAAAGQPAAIAIANPHLQYAVIWFGLAAALAAIYVLWHRQPRP